ncbi:hypothetical protein KC19_5G122800 [Ceratodon purpureus]|uniref:Uncharacterized protein n=1 Tax=Ceratodon purpureus TaxID=3225 RepID=A0A8T0I1T1_CERPU|nr:hypothetical protein KC19_5G122800 [Ceratodon purpureus]
MIGELHSPANDTLRSAAMSIRGEMRKRTECEGLNLNCCSCGSGDGVGASTQTDSIASTRLDTRFTAWMFFGFLEEERRSIERVLDWYQTGVACSSCGYQ